MFNSNKKVVLVSLLIMASFFTLGCGEKVAFNADSEASSSTQKHNQALSDYLDLDADLTQHPDYLDATKGLMASEENIFISNADGETVWSTANYKFIEGDAPDTVNPSLWRQEKLNNIHGLFKVTEGIYQIRGYDISNMTLIKGDTGWIIVDPLTVEETARHAFKFAEEHLGPISIKAVIYTHTHLDHFGGMEGILSVEEVEEQGVRIIAPTGFLEESTSENIMVGIGMGRRASYMYGVDLARNAQGHVGTGLGKKTPFSTYSFIPPNEHIDHTIQTLVIDGLTFEFQYAPDSEAPAELSFYIPEKKAFCGAEITSRTMHNLYTLRGAKVRDALKWSGYIEEVKDIFPEVEVYFASHHWPMWGNENIIDFLSKQADTYKYIHDQSVRMINKGFTAAEIAETIELPEALSKNFSNRGYYGSLKHNVKAVYQFYMGWYDGNPAHLDPHPKSTTASRYVSLMGGSDEVLKASKKAYDEGDYRWASELLNHLVFAEPNNTEARNRLAESYQQLAYQAESGPWRDIYLSGANELINGSSKKPLEPKLMKKVLEQTPTSFFLMAMAANIKPEVAGDERLIINLNFQDTEENFVIRIENSVFHHSEAPIDDEADASIYLTRSFFINIAVLKELNIKKILDSDIKIEGSTFKAIKFLRMMDPPKADFNIIEP